MSSHVFLRRHSVTFLCCTTKWNLTVSVYCRYCLTLNKKKKEVLKMERLFKAESCVGSCSKHCYAMAVTRHLNQNTDSLSPDLQLPTHTLAHRTTATAVRPIYRLCRTKLSTIIQLHKIFQNITWFLQGSEHPVPLAPFQATSKKTHLHYIPTA
jgi:hypothetical protein